MEKSKYELLLSELTQMVVAAKLQAIVVVNQKLLLLYWQVGKRILDTQNEKGWGAKVVQSLSDDLRFAFPDMKGFSVRNLNYMRKFAAAYPNFTIVQPVAAQLSWTHHVILLDSFQEENLRLWYILKSVEQGWSKRILQHQIDQKVHEHFGILLNNFKATLSLPQSDLATSLFKDEYIFEFIAQSEARKERELEKELILHITEFLLSLGKGFSYIGRPLIGRRARFLY